MKTHTEKTDTKRAKGYAPRLLILFITLQLFFGIASANAGDTTGAEKITPTMRLTYQISNGIKSIKVELSHKQGKKFEPVSNVIVNLYNGEIKKYDPATSTGWLGNLVTDSEGNGVFRLTSRFNELTKGTHKYAFIVSLSSDPVCEDTQEEITVNDHHIDISFTSDSLTSVTGEIMMYGDSGLVPVPEAELKLTVKRTFGQLTFSEEGAVTDEKGRVEGVLPADLPGNPDKTITIVARYEDQENDGVIEVSREIPWTVLPHAPEWNERTLWSSGSNAPIALVVVTVSLIALIWGTISYLVVLLFRIRKIR